MWFNVFTSFVIWSIFRSRNKPFYNAVFGLEFQRLVVSKSQTSLKSGSGKWYSVAWDFHIFSWAINGVGTNVFTSFLNLVNFPASETIKFDVSFKTPNLLKYVSGKSIIRSLGFKIFFRSGKNLYPYGNSKSHKKISRVGLKKPTPENRWRV